MSESVDTHSEDPIEIRDSRAFYAFWGDLALLLAAVSGASWAWGPFGPAVIVSWGLEGSRREIIEMLDTAMDSYALSVIRQGAALEP